jgi:predicted NAD/FAD-binding protein
MESDMSFGVSIGGGRLEYGLRNLPTIFAQRRNIANPRFLRMLRDILHFNSNAAQVARTPEMTIGELIETLRMGPWFRDYYLLPLSGAIWSTPLCGILNFPAAALVRFFENHALLGYNGQHQWFTVRGGSVEYVRRLELALRAQGVEIRTGTPVAAVKRVDVGVMVRAQGGEWELFDDVVFGSHSDQTLAMLSDATEAERAALSAIRYQPNEAVLHADTSVMPKRRSVWASWAYCEPNGPRPDRIALTYWMNSLQPAIPQDDPMFVTLNANQPIDDKLVYDTYTFHHPVYDVAALKAQGAIRSMNGTRGTWFCGAWMRNGFHEDGFASAVDVVEAMGRQQSELVAA